MTPGKVLYGNGQAGWLEFSQFKLLYDAGLKLLVEDNGIAGATSDPAISEKAIGDTTKHDSAFEYLDHVICLDCAKWFERAVSQQMHRATGVLGPVYEGSERAGGFNDMRMSLYRAMKTEELIADPQGLLNAVSSPNLMVQAPDIGRSGQDSSSV